MEKIGTESTQHMLEWGGYWKDDKNFYALPCGMFDISEEEFIEEGKKLPFYTIPLMDAPDKDTDWVNWAVVASYMGIPLDSNNLTIIGEAERIKYVGEYYGFENLSTAKFLTIEEIRSIIGD